MVDRIRWDTVSYLPFYYVFFQFLLLTIFNLQANILTTKDILSNLGHIGVVVVIVGIDVWSNKVLAPDVIRILILNTQRNFLIDIPPTRNSD